MVWNGTKEAGKDWGCVIEVEEYYLIVDGTKSQTGFEKVTWLGLYEREVQWTGHAFKDEKVCDTGAAN